MADIAVVNGCRLAFDFVGSEGPVLVLIHGLAGTRRTWRDQVPAFTPEFRVLTWDLRGHGESGAVDSAYSFQELAGDLRGLLDYLGVERCHLLGHSFGGMVALRFALDEPDRVLALILAGTASECSRAAAEVFETRARAADVNGLPDDVRSDNRTDPRAYAGTSRAAAGLSIRPMTPELERLRCPTLLVVGGRDPMGAGGSVKMHRRIADSRLVIEPDRGHFLHREASTWFNDLVLEFLRAAAPQTEHPPMAPSTGAAR